VGQHRIVGSVQQRLVATGFTHCTERLSVTTRAATPPKKVKARICEPISRLVPGPGGFRVVVVGSAEHGHEDLCFSHFTGHSVDDRDRRACVINKELLAGKLGCFKFGIVAS
jgi:hypothetical protein